MYDKIKRNRHERTTGFKAAVTTALAVLVFVSALLIWGISYKRQYWDYVSHLSNSTVYAYSHHSMHADVQGDLVWVRGENVQSLYSYITASGSGRPAKAPELEPSIRIEYGDGAMLRLYPSDHEKFSVYILYEDAQEGYSYGYLASGMTVETFAVNYLSLAENVLWTAPIPD